MHVTFWLLYSQPSFQSTRIISQAGEETNGFFRSLQEYSGVRMNVSKDVSLKIQKIDRNPLFQKKDCTIMEAKSERKRSSLI